MLMCSSTFLAVKDQVVEMGCMTKDGMRQEKNKAWRWKLWRSVRQFCGDLGLWNLHEVWIAHCGLLEAGMDALHVYDIRCSRIILIRILSLSVSYHRMYKLISPAHNACFVSGVVVRAPGKRLRGMPSCWTWGSTAPSTGEGAHGALQPRQQV